MNEKKGLLCVDLLQELLSLMQLNDDCLYNIFNKLSIKEQLKLTTICERFRFVITHMIWRTQFQETRTDDVVTDELNNRRYQDLFYHIVEHIEKFTIAGPYKGRYDRRPEPAFYLCSHFPRLIHFECHDPFFHDGLLRLVVENCPKLQVLRLTSCFGGSHITSVHIKYLRNLRELYCGFYLSSEHLSYLNLTHLDVASSKTLSIPFNELGFSKLRYLKLSENQIEPGFAKKCSYLRNLECLTVTHIKQYAAVQDVSTWQDLYENLGARIVTLKISSAQNPLHCMLAFAANTSKLTALEKLFFKGHWYDDYLNDFARLPALKEFQQCINKYTDPASILNFISRSKYLQRLDLIYCGPLFCPLYLHWLLDIIEVLSEQKGRSILCLNLVFLDLIISEDVLMNFKRQVLVDVRYVNQSLLKITFDNFQILNDCI